MESTVSLVILSVVWTLLLAAVIFLALLHSKTTTNQLRFLMSLQERQSQQWQEQSDLQREWLTETLAAISSASSASQAALLQAAQQMILAQQKATEAAMFGASSSVTELAKLVQSTTSFLATKDPIAYQTAMGAQQFAPVGSEQEPYTSTDAIAQSQAAEDQKRRAAIDEAIGKMMNFAGSGGPQDVPHYPIA